MKIKLVFFLLPFIVAIAQPKIPVIKNYAEDETSTLTNSELSTLNSTLKTFEDSTSNQIVFLMIPALDGYPLESYTYEVSTQNKIGSKKNNNGVLFFVAKNDHKMRIEVGYGLEGAIPDALASSILRNEVRPYFMKDDYYSGVEAGLSAIMKATIGEYKNDKKDDEEGFKFPFGVVIMIIIFIILSSRGGKRGGGGILPWLIIGSMGGGRSSGGGGFSGGSGGFGGFSGGGGGFGGGGASGSW